MLGIVLRTAITAGGLWLATTLFDGIQIDSTSTLIWAAILLGLVNALVRPLCVLLTLPATVVTLGGFLLVINAAMFGLVAWFLEGFQVSGFFAALLGAIVVSIVSWLANSFIGPDGRYQVMIIHQDTR